MRLAIVVLLAACGTKPTPITPIGNAPATDPIVEVPPPPCTITGEVHDMDDAGTAIPGATLVFTSKAAKEAKEAVIISDDSGKFSLAIDRAATGTLTVYYADLIFSTELTRCPTKPMWLGFAGGVSGAIKPLVVR